jgi:hypothetical protein
MTHFCGEVCNLTSGRPAICFGWRPCRLGYEYNSGTFGEEDDCKESNPDECISASNPFDDDTCYNGTDSGAGSSIA